jgi:hypothetical protein
MKKLILLIITLLVISACAKTKFAMVDLMINDKAHFDLIDLEVNGCKK